MIAIGKSKGKAKEYNLYSCNTYYGCGHACNYNKNGGCYAAAMAVRFGWFKSIKDFQNNPRPREGIVEALRKDAKKLGDQYKKDCKENTAMGWSIAPPPFIFLCFTCDPYQPINQKYQLTRQAIEILHENGLGVNILTKGKITDFDLLAKNPHLSKVGVTYTGADDDIEPVHAILYKRMHNLIRAKNNNIKTWVSLEPVVEPHHVIKFIEDFYTVVDEFKIGKWNYSKEADKIDWRKFTNEAIELLEKLGCKYYIKEDLRKYIK